ncbi:MAG: 3-ketoacyl-ACP reductase [Clostridiales bacterium]|nr:3-ketoacyl-ACP reductase [Clostridiales bacterium]
MQKKVALVTGGARGIGLAVSAQLAKEGYNLAVLGTSAEDRVKENLDQIRAYGNDLIYVQGSLGDEKDREKLLKTTLDHYGRIDVLVNNAGVAPKVRADILETSEESFDYVLDINLKGTFFLTQAVANQMLNQSNQEDKDNDYQGVIIIVSSMSEYTASINRGEYCISKAGLGMVTKLFADRLADEGILVYEIRPGIIRTDMTKTVTEKYDNLISDGILPRSRWGEPQDVADAVSVLCSGKLAYSVGQTIDVDGGFHIRRL